MKSRKYFIFTAIIIFIIAIFPVNTIAAGSSLSGPATVRSGDEITVKFTLSGLSNADGIQATINYTGSVLTFKSISGNLSSPWKVESNRSGSSIRIIAYDDSGSTKLSGTRTICTMKFSVKGPTGTSFSVNASNVKVSVNGSDVGVGSSSYTKNIAAPLSSNANLSSMTVSNAKVYPSFSPSVFTYKTNVKYEVSKLNISAKAQDSSSKISISNNSLKAGATTNVKVTVRAAAGNTKTYTIKATREQNPNYVASSNNYLSSISLNLGILSPVFSKEITDYVVWLPYEISNISVSAKPEDSKANVKISGGESLMVGADNTVSVVCAAENGSEREYKIIVKRASSLIQTQGNISLTNVDGVLAQIEKLKDDSAEQNILLDLSSSASKQVPAKLFNELKKHAKSVLTVNIGNVKIVFRASDISEDINEDYYDFSFISNGEYANLIKEKAGDENGIVFSFAYEGALPGYATFYLMTNLYAGDQYNIYKYDMKEDKFYLIAQDAKVLQAGILPYMNNTCSEYIITKSEIKDAVVYDSVSRQGSINTVADMPLYKNDIMYVLIIILALIIGFAAGATLYKNHSAKKSSRKESNIITECEDKSAEETQIT